MRTTAFVAMALAGALGTGGARLAAQTPDRVLQLSFDTDGRVTLRAQNVTPREILAEWARQCSCFLVNAEKLTGDAVMVPLLFERQPQSVVLGSLLRPAAGYVLTPRRAGATGPSEFETIFILATSNPTGGSFTPTTSSMPTPVLISSPGSPENEIPPVPEISGAPASNVQPPGQSTTPKPTTGYPGPFVPIVPAAPSSNPFTPPAPNRGGGPATTPGQPPAPPPGGTVGANP